METLEKFLDIKEVMETIEDENDKNDFMRREVIAVLSEQSKESRQITIKQAESGKTDECDEEKSKAIVFLRCAYIF